MTRGAAAEWRELIPPLKFSVRPMAETRSRPAADRFEVFSACGLPA
jgi:hypothetical protein